MVIHTRGQQNVYSTLRHVESHIFLQWVLIENQTKTLKKKDFNELCDSQKLNIEGFAIGQTGALGILILELSRQIGVKSVAERCENI